MCIAGIRLYTIQSNRKIPGMIYEFVIELRVKGLSDLKLERNFRILMEIEFEFKDNYDRKISINHGLKKKIDRSVDSFQFID